MHLGTAGVDLELPAEAELSLEAWAEGMQGLLTVESHRATVELVKKNGAGICSSCRWSSGCHRCDWVKAVRYYRNIEVRGRFLEGYGPAAKAKARKPLKISGGGSAEEVPLCKSECKMDV